MPISRQAILAVDTASPVSGIAVAEHGGLLTEIYLDDGQARGERLADLSVRALSESGLVPSDLRGVGVCVGPGSYTGLRVGLSFVRGIALVDDLPTVGIGSLELLALAARDSVSKATMCAVLSAGRERVYAAMYRASSTCSGLQEIAEPDVFSLSELNAFIAGVPDVVLCHDKGFRPPPGGVRCLEVSTGRAGVLALAATARLAKGGGKTAEAVLPTYVGAMNARKNRNRVVVGASRCD